MHQTWWTNCNILCIFGILQSCPLKCSTTLRRSRSCRYHHRHMNLRRNKMKQACLEWYKHPKNHKDEYLSSTYSLLTIQMGVHASIFHRKCAHRVDQSHDTQLQLHLGRHGDQQHHQWEPNCSHHQIQIDSDVFRSTWKSTGDRFQLSSCAIKLGSLAVYLSWVPLHWWWRSLGLAYHHASWFVSMVQNLHSLSQHAMENVEFATGTAVFYTNAARASAGIRHLGVSITNMKTLLCTI